MCVPKIFGIRFTIDVNQNSHIVNFRKLKRNAPKHVVLTPFVTNKKPQLIAELGLSYSFGSLLSFKLNLFTHFVIENILV